MHRPLKIWILTLRNIYKPLVLAVFCLCTIAASGQEFSLEAKSDTLYHLVMTSGRSVDRWTLRGRVLRLATGDVDGDGSTDAIVVIERRTRYDRRLLPRLWLFRNVRGYIRPLWLGSQLGGILVDARFSRGQVCSLQKTIDERYVAMTHRWMSFGLGADSILVKGTDRATAEKHFLEY